MMKIDWGFLATFNTVAFKGWSAVWLWIGTFCCWGLALLLAVWLGKDLPDAWLATWLTGLAAYSGIGALQYRAMRETDYGALERKAGTAAPTKEGA